MVRAGISLPALQHANSAIQQIAPAFASALPASHTALSRSSSASSPAWRFRRTSCVQRFHARPPKAHIEQREIIGEIGCSLGTDSQDEVFSKAGAAVINQLAATNK